MNIMKRLTFDGKFCDISMCQFAPGGSFCEEGDCSQRRVWERLKSIEDILGGDYNLDRLRELVQAEREGRCDEAELTPCPFCGGEASVGKWSASRTVDIWCSNPECDALQSGTAKSYKAAFEIARAKWNRRAGEEEQDG